MRFQAVINLSVFDFNTKVTKNFTKNTKFIPLVFNFFAKRKEKVTSNKADIKNLVR